MRPPPYAIRIAALALICGCSNAPSRPARPARRPGAAQETTPASPARAARDQEGARPAELSERVAAERERLVSRAMDAERRLAGTESELERARETIALMEDRLRVQEVVLEDLKAKADATRPVERGASRAARLSSRLSGRLLAAQTELKRARTTIELLEDDIQVKDAMLTGSKVEIDKAVRAQISTMYRKALTGEKAAEIAGKQIIMLKNQLAALDEDLARARKEIAKLRGERPVEAPRGD